MIKSTQTYIAPKYLLNLTFNVTKIIDISNFFKNILTVRNIFFIYIIIIFLRRIIINLLSSYLH